MNHHVDFPPLYSERIGYHKIYLQESLLNLDVFLVAAGSAAGGGTDTGPGGLSWVGPGMDLTAAPGRTELVKSDDSVPTEGWAGTPSSPLRETQGAAGRIFICILMQGEILLPSLEFMIPL